MAYGQFSRLSNQWLGLEDFNGVDKRSMGGRRKKIFKKFDFQPLDEVLDAIAHVDERRVYDVISFYIDYEKSIKNVAKVVKSGGIVAYVVGNRRVKGIEIPNDEITRAFFERNDFMHQLIIVRAIPNKRMPKKNSPSNIVGKTDTTMNYEYIVILIKKFLIFTLFLFFIASCNTEGTTTCKSKKPRYFDLLAFYYPWYGNPEVSGQWHHWDAAGHDPDKLVNGLPDLASSFHPLLGAYDSSNIDVIEQHLRWAQYAGIDAFIISWWGRGDFTDQVSSKIFQVDGKMKDGIKLTFYYEKVTDSTEGIIADFDYLYKNYLTSPVAYRFNGRPVVFLYGRSIFSGFWCILNEKCSKFKSYIDWSSMLSYLREKYNILLVADVMSPRFKSVMEKVVEMGFEAIHVYNPALEFHSGFDPYEHYRLMKKFASSHSLLLGLTVLPGYDDTNIGREFSFKIDRKKGEFYRELIAYALKFSPEWIIITSFNEWHEGTQIEPSVEYGNFYLELTRSLLGDSGNSCRENR